MEWFALVIPIILSLTALYFYKHKITFWEIILPIVVGVIVIAIMKTTMVYSAANDIEYLSEFPVKATYFEEWDEWIDETCEDCTTDEDGNVSCTEYDCSYREYHSEFWQIKTNTGSYINISQSYYNYLVKIWGNKNFVNMHRDYYRIDGDSYVSKWNKKFNTIEPRTFTRYYTNKPQTARTVFKFRELDSIELTKVYNYPKIKEFNRQVNCINCNRSDNEYLEKINALIGVNKQIKIYIINFKDKPYSHSELQKIYWKGGNKNELIICVGNDWVNTFSWADDKLVQVETNELFNNRELTMTQKIKQLRPIIENHWKRKEFSDFNYIKIQLTGTQIFWIYFTVTILSGAILVWGVLNEFEQE
jgi:hypothetical protein